MILGDASPPGSLTSLLPVEVWVTRFTLAGAPPSAVFTKIRVRVEGSGSDGNIRGVVYAPSGATAGALLDWAPFVILGGQALGVVEQPLSGLVAATDGDYYLGVQFEAAGKVGILSAGGLGNGKTRTVAYGAAPPDPFTSSGDLTNWTMCVEVDVEALTATGGPADNVPHLIAGRGASW